MKKLFVVLGIVILFGFTAGFAFAEDTLPPLPVPVVDDSATDTATATVTDSTTPEATPTPSPSPSPVQSVLSVTTSSAETGSNLYILLALSGLGGLGLFCIKKYFDTIKYQI
jgi:nitrous oxide reductase accessory protein NosL